VSTGEPSPPRAEQPTPRRRSPAARIGPLLRVLVGALATVVVLLTLTLLFILGTQPGLRAAVQLAERMTPEGMFRVGTVEGRVLGRLHLADLELHLPALDVSLQRFDWHWSPSSLFVGRIALTKIAAHGIDLAFGAGEPKPAEPPGSQAPSVPIKLPEIVSPVAVELSEVLIEDLSLTQRGAATEAFRLRRARLAASLDGSELTLSTLEAQITKPLASARANGRVGLADAYPIDLTLDWSLKLPATAQGGLAADPAAAARRTQELDLASAAPAETDAGPGGSRPVRFQGQGRVDGDLRRLRLEHQLRGAARIELDLVAENLLEAPRWEGSVEILAVDLPLLSPGAPAIDLEGQLTTKGDLQEASLAGRLDGRLAEQEADLPDFGRLAVVLDALWKDQRLNLRTFELNESKSGAHFDAEAELDLAAEPPSFRIQGGWERLRWPLAGDLIVASPRGDLQAQGTLDDYRFDLATSAAGDSIPDTEIKVEGSGSLQEVRLAAVNIRTLDGEIEGQAEASWETALSWAAQLEIDQVNPGAYAADWPGVINGRISSSGRLEADGPRVEAIIEGVDGRLRGYPIDASGRIQIAGRTVRIEDLVASSGPSTAKVDGALDEAALDLSFDISSPDLASLLPQAGGSLSIRGQVEGTLEAPQIQAQLTAKNAEVAGQGIAELSGDIDVAVADDGVFNVQLDGRRLIAGGLNWDSLRVRGEGSIGSHRLRADLAGQPVGVKLALTGGMGDSRQYAGKLDELAIATVDFGTWTLQRPAHLQFAPPQLRAGPLCMREGDGSGGCVEFEQSGAGKWIADINLDQLGFGLLAGALPDTVVAEGGGRVTGRLSADGPDLSGGLTAVIPEGRIRAGLAGADDTVLDFSGTKLSLKAEPGGLNAQLDLPLADLGRVAGRLQLSDWSLADPARPAQPLAGGLRARVDNLRPIAGLAPDVSDVSGAIDVDLSLDGTIAQPGLSGYAKVVDFGAQVPLLNLVVQDFDLNVEASSLGRLDYRGQADIGGGQFELTGESRLAEDGLYARLEARGTNLKVADTREYFALVSPVFDVEISPELASVRGEVLIPEARIRPREFPAGTVTPSSDVVLEAEEREESLPMELEIELRLGDEVTVDTFGVRGRLAGELVVFQRPGREMLADGQLQIIDGKYRFSGLGIRSDIGPELDIVQGRLIYAKGPIGNPGLLLQAERGGGSTTAGVRVMGTIRQPKLAFFSESDPDMTQAEVTKYLLTGIPPSNESRDSDASLAVGTYVAPKIFVEYENGLGDQGNTVRLRYDLTKRIELQTETGESAGGDIFFSFER